MNEVVRPKRLVLVALGGNALIKPGQRGTTEEHQQNAKETAEHLWGLVDHGHNLIITHGNGPQVGDIMLRNELARDKVPPNPLDVMTVEEADMHLKAGEFAPGSMSPKIEAAIEYITTCQREVIITSADKLQAAIDGKTGTRIIPTY